MNTPQKNSNSVLNQSRQDQIEIAVVLLKAGATVDVVSNSTALSKAMINEIIIREDLVKPWKIRKQLREAERALKMESNHKSSQNLERDLEIVQLAQLGMTLREIATKMGISSERVRKILKINGAMSPRSVRQQEKAEVRTAIDLVQRSLRDWIKTHMGCTIVELSLGAGVSEIECTSNIPSDVDHLVLSPRANPSANRWTTVKWTDSQVLDAMRAAAVISMPLSYATYDRIRNEYPIDGPSAIRILQRFRTWNEACSQAGVEPGHLPREIYTRKWTAEEMIIHLGEFMRNSSTASHQAYNAWSRTHEGAPNGQTIRNECGTWSECCQLALLDLRKEWTSN
jgi:hypothetical protein